MSLRTPARLPATQLSSAKETSCFQSGYVSCRFSRRRAPAAPRPSDRPFAAAASGASPQCPCERPQGCQPPSFPPPRKRRASSLGMSAAASRRRAPATPRPSDRPRTAVACGACYSLLLEYFQGSRQSSSSPPDARRPRIPLPESGIPPLHSLNTPAAALPCNGRVGGSRVALGKQRRRTNAEGLCRGRASGEKLARFRSGPFSVHELRHPSKTNRRARQTSVVSRGYNGTTTGTAPGSNRETAACTAPHASHQTPPVHAPKLPTMTMAQPRNVTPPVHAPKLPTMTMAQPRNVKRRPYTHPSSQP
eukprot:scaffold72092_cov72-Phaeocystis_antarctica.AAC.3